MDGLGRVLPSLSAAILPIVLHCDNWYYPLYVCALTGIIVVGRQTLDHFSGAANAVDITVPEKKPTSKEHFNELLHWGKLLAAVLIVAAFAITYHWMFVIAPPLIVAFVELSKPDGTLRQKSGSVFVLLVLAAFAGVFWLYAGTHILRWPVWISAALSMASVYLFFHTLKLSFRPPLPLRFCRLLYRLKVYGLIRGMWQSAVGSAAFILLSLLWFKPPDAPGITGEFEGRAVTG